MKFGQLIEYNIRKNVLQKSYANCGRETIPRPFSKKSKLRIESIVLRFYTACFFVEC